MASVDVYDTKTGQKLPYQQPEHIVDHPVLGTRLSRIPSTRDQDTLTGPPSTEWTVAQLETYAETNGIDLSGFRSSKADRVAAIDAATHAGLNPAQTSDDNVQDSSSPTGGSDTTEPPADGDQTTQE